MTSKRNPYAPPNAAVDDVPVVARSKRPVIIGLTQILVLLAGLVAAFGLVGGLIAIPRSLASGAPAWQLALILALQTLVTALLGWLFVAVSDRRRGGFVGGVVFATMLVVLMFVSRATQPRIEYPPEQLLGAAVGEVLVVILVVMYPLRMYFSKAVRAYYGKSH